MAGRERLKRDGVGGSYFAGPKLYLNVVPTGCKVLDLALGGGWVEGRIANIVGDKSTGKTLLCIEAAANFAIKHKVGRILYRESEAAFDPEYARALGMPVDRIEFGDEPIETVEDFFEDLTKVTEGAVANGKPVLYILDSLDALSDREELERDIDKDSYGANKAKKLSELFRRVVRHIYASSVTLLIVSQVRSKIGALAFAKKTTRSGGRALDFYATHVVFLSQTQTLTRTINKVKRPVGIEVRAKIEKNKIAMPYREAIFEIEFGYGVDNDLASLDWLKAHGFKTDEHGLKVDNFKGAELDALVERRWYEIERAFLPKRRKYGD